MSQGITIPSSKFKAITDALDANKIGWTVWNAEVMTIKNYNGPIDLNCDNDRQFKSFQDIVFKIKKE